MTVLAVAFVIWRRGIEIPSQEPTEFRAGETIIWTRLIDEFKASDSWTLAYTIIGATARYTTVSVITDPLNASGFKATLSATNSALIPAGTNYELVGLVSKAGEVHQVYAQRLTVLPAVTAAYDPRSEVKKALDTIEAAILAWANGGVQSYSISVGGSSRTITRTDMSQVIVMQDKLRSQYQAELDAAKLKKTGIDPRHLHVRLTRV